jgi:hypothetical protein
MNSSDEKAVRLTEHREIRYLTPDYLSPGLEIAQRQTSRTSAIASLAGGLPPDPREPDPPQESLRGCIVLAGCVLIAGESV